VAPSLNIKLSTNLIYIVNVKINFFDLGQGVSTADSALLGVAFTISSLPTSLRNQNFSFLNKLLDITCIVKDDHVVCFR
jgi:hypothetical protein